MKLHVISFFKWKGEKKTGFGKSTKTMTGKA